MVFSVSPSVTIKEVDLTTAIPAITTPPAAIAGVFRWGPTDERVLISSEVELANVFGKPTDFNAETFFTAADYLSYSNALYVTRVTDNTTATANSTYFDAKYPGEIGNSIGVALVTVGSSETTPTAFSSDAWDSDAAINVVGQNADTYAEVTINNDVIEFGTSTFFVETTESTLDIKVGDTIRVMSGTYGFQDLEVSVVTENTESANTDPYVHKIEFANRYTLPETDATLLTFERKWGFAAAVNDAPLAGTMHIIVYDVDGKISGTAGQILEKYENVSGVSSAKLPDGTNNYYKEVLNGKSRYIKSSNTDVVVSSQLREYVVLSNGADGNNESNVSLGDIARGYDLYKEANDVDVSFILQGKATSSNLANYIVSNISEYRRDCIAFISPRKEDVTVGTEQDKLNSILTYRNAIQNSSYWFLDSGYKYRYDKYNDVYRWIPLNGDMAGLASSVEPWESPAGYRKGRVRNVVKLAFNPNKAQRDQLYGKDVNPVITQVGQGTVLFGDKTGLGTATGSAFTRINVRRLFITVEKAIASISAQFLFEFNDEFTQTQFKNIVDPLLRDIQGRRGIIDFRTVSDATINTPDVIDKNTFRSNIFIKPARSINFIELTFVATRSGVEFEELVGLQF